MEQKDRFDTLYLDEKRQHDVGIAMGSYDIHGYEARTHQTQPQDLFRNQLDKKKDKKNEGWCCCILPIFIILGMGGLIIYLIGKQQKIL